MFSIIFCFLPLFLIPLTLYFSKKRKSLSWEIKKGKICYNCKESFNLSDRVLMSRLMDDKEHVKLCISCSRECKINCLRNPIKKIYYKFQNFTVRKKSNKISFYFILFALFFIGLDLLLNFLGINLPLFFLYGTSNIVFWFINIYQLLYTSKKKVSE